MLPVMHRLGRLSSGRRHVHGGLRVAGMGSSTVAAWPAPPLHHRPRSFGSNAPKERESADAGQAGQAGQAERAEPAAASGDGKLMTYAKAIHSVWLWASNSKDKLLRAGGKVVQKSSDAVAGAAWKQSVSSEKYSRLTQFGETFSVQCRTVESIHDAVRSMEIPDECKSAICGKIKGDAVFVRNTPNRCDYTASEDKNGGLGYKYDMYCQWDEGTQLYTFILVIAGVSFELESEVTYLEEKRQVPAGRRCVHTGWFTNTYEDVYKEETHFVKKYVPRGITAEQFDELIVQQYQRYYHISGKSQLKALTA